MNVFGVVPTFRENRFLQFLIVVFIIFWTVMAVSPYDRYDWLMENVSMLAVLVVLAILYRFFKFSNLAYLLIFILTILHTFGAHYTYVSAPLDPWLNKFFSFKRNNFDRLVHFSYGLLITYPVFEFLRRVVKLHGFWSYVLAIAAIMAIGAFYELIEMWGAFMVSPDQKEKFLGTQGDMWDTQHDMAAALYGGIIAMVVTALVSQKGEKYL